MFSWRHILQVKRQKTWNLWRNLSNNRMYITHIYGSVWWPSNSRHINIKYEQRPPHSYMYTNVYNPEFVFVWYCIWTETKKTYCTRFEWDRVLLNFKRRHFVHLTDCVYVCIWDNVEVIKYTKLNDTVFYFIFALHILSSLFVSW